MADSSKNKTDKRVFDVAKPSTTPASPTSKPLIIAHGPMMHDSTIVEQSESDETEKTDDHSPSMTSTHTIKIEPLNEIELDKREEAATPNEDQKRPVATDDKDSAKSTTQDIKSDQIEKTDSEVKTETPDAPKVEAQAEGSSDQAKVEVDPKKLEEEQRAIAEKEAKINSLVDSGKYFLPINMLEKRKNQRIVLVGILICIILAIAWVDVALDAGLISNSLHLPHTHFFALKS